MKVPTAMILFVLLLANTSDGQQSNLAQQKQALQIEQKQLREQYTDNHPKVLHLQEKLEAVLLRETAEESRRERSDAENQLQQLETERARLTAEFGPKHPTIRLLDQRAEALKEHLKNTPTDTVADIEKRLLPLLIQREEHAQTFGANHPSTKALDQQIEILKRRQGEAKPIAKSAISRTMILKQIDPNTVTDILEKIGYGPTKVIVLRADGSNMIFLQCDDAILKKVKELLQQLDNRALAVPLKEPAKPILDQVEKPSSENDTAGQNGSSRTISELRNAYLKADQHSATLARQLRNEVDKSLQAKLKKELRASVKLAFESRVELQQAQIRAAASDLTLARERLDKRRIHADAIIARRVQELEIETNLDWNTTTRKDAAQPEAKLDVDFDGGGRIKKVSLASDESDSSEDPLLRAMINYMPMMAQVRQRFALGALTNMVVFKSSNGCVLSADGKQYRRFLDTNRDGNFDRWIFFEDGKEAYEESDIDFDGTPDCSSLRSLVGDADLKANHQKYKQEIVDQITEARGELSKTLKNAEEEYAQFRKDAPLEFEQPGILTTMLGNLQVRQQDIDKEITKNESLLAALKVTLTKTQKDDPSAIPKKQIAAAERLGTTIAELAQEKKETEQRVLDTRKQLKELAELQLQDKSLAQGVLRQRALLEKIQEQLTKVHLADLSKDAGVQNGPYLSVNFQQQKYPDVLEWLAHTMGRTLDLGELPSGTFSYRQDEPVAAIGFAGVVSANLKKFGYELIVQPNRLIVGKIQQQERADRNNDSSRIRSPGLKAVSHISLSPDERHLYAASENHERILVFGRKRNHEPITHLVQTVYPRREISKSSRFNLEQLPDQVSTVAHIIVTPNGKYVLASSMPTQAVNLFGRDTVTGELTHLFTARDGIGKTIGLHQPFALAVSPDSKFVYVTNSVTQGRNVLPRFGNGCVTALEITDEKLKWIETTPGINDCFDGATEIVMHPTGKWMYVACMNSEAVVTIARENDDKELQLKQIVRDDDLLSIGGASALAVSDDGEHLYCASGHWQGERGITSFRINTDKVRGKLKVGALTPMQILRRGSPGLEDFAGARQLHLSPDGNHLFVLDSARGTIVSLSRNPTTGRLSPEQDAELRLSTKPSSITSFVPHQNGKLFVADSDAASLSLFNL